MGAAAAAAVAHWLYVLCFSAGYSNFERQGSHDNISVLHICTGGEGAQPLPSLVLVERKWMSGSFKKKKKKEKDEKDGDYNRRTYFPFRK